MNGNKPAIGFIGLGLMGGAMTRRLCAAGFTVTGYDIVAARLQDAESHGVTAAPDPAAVAAASDIICLCVTTTAAVADVVAGPGGILSSAGPGKIILDFSTTEVEETRRLAAQARTDKNIGWVDAPVSGGVPGAKAGTLAVMAGGDAADIAAVTPIADVLAGAFTHMGPVGAGQVTKMVNQILVLTNYCVLAEALAMAEAGGIDAEKLPAALGSGHAGSNLLAQSFPRLIARDFAPAGYARQVLKDLEMVQSLARDLKVPTPMSAQAGSLYRILVSKGHGELDGLSILKLFDKNAGV